MFPVSTLDNMAVLALFFKQRTGSSGFPGSGRAEHRTVELKTSEFDFTVSQLNKNFVKRQSRFTLSHMKRQKYPIFKVLNAITANPLLHFSFVTSYLFELNERLNELVPLCCVRGAGKCTVDGKRRYHKHKRGSYWKAAAAAQSWHIQSAKRQKQDHV